MTICHTFEGKITQNFSKYSASLSSKFLEGGEAKPTRGLEAGVATLWPVAQSLQSGARRHPLLPPGGAG